MVYAAYGISGVTSIVGTFYIKDHLGISPEFLAALGFWAGIPWALKMPVGHLVDLIWRWKAVLVFVGAGLIAASLGIMVGLIAHTEAMRAWMPVEEWFVLSVLLAPTGYMIQDAVADAMTVEAVPRVDERGAPYSEAALKEMHTTMQTLGRVALIGGLALVALVNVYLFHDTEKLPPEQKTALYAQVYALALVIPVVSVLGVLLHAVLRPRSQAARDKTEANWWVLGGSLVFVVIALSVGLSRMPFGQEAVFAGSAAVIIALLWRLARELDPGPREVLVATALVLFVFRAVPATGAGTTWWMIDVLGFDQSFLARLGLVAYVMTLIGMFALRRYMARTSIAGIVVMLTIAGTLLALPTIGMYYGLHEWTARHTGGLVDARTIALIDTALESPLGQIAMIPMLAWIANSAPANLKATYFAVMASFANLALAASNLGTKYLNQVFVVTRKDFGQVGELLIAAALIGLVAPLAAVALVRIARLRVA